MDQSTEKSRQFTENLRRSHRQIFGYIFALLRNLEDTQDVFQQTSLVLWDRFDEFQPGTNFAGWACKVAQFKVRDFLKSRRRYEAHLSEAFAMRLASLQAEISPEELELRNGALAECLEKLPKQQREILNNCYSEAPIAQAAIRLGRPVRSLYNSLRRIRESLLDCIERTLARETRI